MQHQNQRRFILGKYKLMYVEKILTSHTQWCVFSWYEARTRVL